jgi:hypothetical protein
VPGARVVEYGQGRRFFLDCHPGQAGWTASPGGKISVQLPTKILDFLCK